MLIKKQISTSTFDKSIKISLSKSDNQLGFQDTIDSIAIEEVDASPNDVIDREEIRFMYSGTSLTYDFDFMPTPANGLLNEGFTIDEITGRTEQILRSFYIIKIYDTNNSNKQTQLHSGYLAGKQIADSGNTTTYVINDSYEFGDFYFPKYFVDSYTGQTLYARLFFYNAKSGTLSPFYNYDNDSFTDEARKLYFSVVLDVENRKYGLVSGSTINAREIVNTTYVDTVNSNFDSFENQKPTFPSGNLFSGGTYTNINIDGSFGGEPAPPFASLVYDNVSPAGFNVFAGDPLSFSVEFNNTNFTPVPYQLVMSVDTSDPIALANVGFSGGSSFNISGPDPRADSYGTIHSSSLATGSTDSFTTYFVNDTGGVEDDSFIITITLDLLTDKENNGSYTQTDTFSYVINPF